MPSQRVLLTSVCRPLGPAHGDSVSVSYEVLYGQVTLAQGLFSPRNVALHYGLDYIAANLDTPAVCLHYPSERELVRELETGGYSHVGITFNLPTAHRMRRISELVRRHASGASIVLGGYGAAIPDAELVPYCDAICRGEGVGFMRAVLGEPAREPPYDHPLSLTDMSLLGAPLGKSALLFGGLGCPNGCDFCATSHFFQRRHIRLLPTGRHIYDVIRAYLELAPDLNFTVLDEDFLLNRRRALELRELVQADGLDLDLFCFGSQKALSQYSAEELVEIGVGGVWIGYEGKRAGYDKMQGRPFAELVADLKRHGIIVLCSMILGLDYHTPELLHEEFDELMAMEPTYGQYTIYAPLCGTALAERIEREGRWRARYREDRELRYRYSDGFACLFDHPAIPAEELERLQRWCFEEEFRRLGPSVLRYAEAWEQGYRNLKERTEPALQRRAESLRRRLEQVGAMLPAARVFAPSAMARQRARDLGSRIEGPRGLRARLKGKLMGAAGVPLAAATAASLKVDALQHPKLTRNDWGAESRPPVLRFGEDRGPRTDQVTETPGRSRPRQD